MAIFKKKFIIDINTRNLSFIQTAVDLKHLGIKNNMFFLRLYDPSLRGVDPYDPDLTEDQVFRIINECIVNPWYYLREVARIPDQGNTAGIPYQLNRANLAATWCFLHNLDHYLVIPRQIGKTQSTLAILLWSFLFGSTNSEMMFINKMHEDAINNLARLKDQRELLPKFLQFKIMYDDEGKLVKETDNVKTLANQSNGNKIVTKPSARSVETAEKIGRGSTQPLQYYDEVEFSPYIKTIMESAGPAYNTASQNAKRNGSAYCRIFTSTPGDLDSQPGQDAEKIVADTCRWTEEMYDWDSQRIDDYIQSNSRNGIVYIEYQYQQLGKDEKWFKEICRLLNNNPVKIKREVFLKRMRGSSSSPYEMEDLQALMELVGVVKEEIFINKIFKINLYETLKKKHCYFIGVDVANGYGEDNTAVTIWDPYTLKTVGEFKSPNIGVKDLIQFLYVLVSKHLPMSILAIERNANGEAVLDHLRGTAISQNIYWDTSKEAEVDQKLDAKGFVAEEAKRRKLYGIWTGTKSRELMYGLLETYIVEYKDKIIGENIIADIMKLVRTKTGKIAAAEGEHDDSVMSFLMCLYLYYHGKNLSRFGFVRGQLPEEENRNKGLTYDEVEEYLSDGDKKFFEGVDRRSYEEIDMTARINAMRSETRHEFDPVEEEVNKNEYSIMKIKDPYERAIAREMLAATRESEQFNARIKSINGSVNMEIEDGYYYGNMDIFDELNK